MNEVFITGASGFVGQHLLRALSPSFLVKAISRKEITSIARGATVIHLASPNVASAVQENPEFYLKEAQTLAHQILEQNPARVLYASSAAVYGDQILTPRLETESLNPPSAYGRLKLAIETLFLNELKSACIVFRQSNIYGSGMSPANVVSAMLKQAENPEPILESSHPVRDFLHVSDLSLAYSKALQKPQTSGIYNVGTGVGTSVAELAALVLEHSPRYRKLSAGSISCLILDCSKAKEHLGWQSKVDLKTGIKNLAS